MAAATVNGNSYVENPQMQGRIGLCAVPITHLFPTTSLDDVGDRVNLASILAGKKLVAIFYDCADLGGATFDMDFVVSEDALDTAAGTETIIYNAANAFAALQTGITLFPLSTLARPLQDNVDGNIAFRSKVNTADTAIQGQLTGLIMVQ